MFILSVSSSGHPQQIFIFEDKSSKWGLKMGCCTSKSQIFFKIIYTSQSIEQNKYTYIYTIKTECHFKCPSVS